MVGNFWRYKCHDNIIFTFVNNQCRPKFGIGQILKKENGSGQFLLSSVPDFQIRYRVNVRFIFQKSTKRMLWYGIENVFCFAVMCFLLSGRFFCTMIFSHPGCCLSCHHIFVVVNLHYGFDGEEAGNGCILDYREHRVHEQPFLIQLISLIRFVNDTCFQGSGFVDDGGRYIRLVKNLPNSGVF